MIKLFPGRYDPSRHMIGGPSGWDRSQSVERLQAQPTVAARAASSELPQEAAPISASEAIATLKDGLRIQATGALSRQEKAVITRVVEASREGLPEPEDLQRLQAIVKKFSAQLKGDALPEPDEVRNVTKRFAIGGVGFGDKKLTAMIADRQAVQGQIDATGDEIALLKKIQSRTPSEKDQLKLGVQIAQLEQQQNVNEAKLLHLERQIVSNPETTYGTLIRVASSASAEIKLAVAAHPNASRMALEVLCKDPDPAVSERGFRRLMSDSPNYNTEFIVGNLSDHPNPEVRLSLARHFNTQGYILEKLSVDVDPEVAQAAQRNLAIQLPPDAPYGGDYMVHHHQAMRDLEALPARLAQAGTLQEVQECEGLMQQYCQVLTATITLMHLNSSSVSTGEDQAKATKDAVVGELDVQLAARRQALGG